MNKSNFKEFQEKWELNTDECVYVYRNSKNQNEFAIRVKDFVSYGEVNNPSNFLQGVRHIGKDSEDSVLWDDGIMLLQSHKESDDYFIKRFKEIGSINIETLSLEFKNVSYEECLKWIMFSILCDLDKKYPEFFI